MDEQEKDSDQRSPPRESDVTALDILLFILQHKRWLIGAPVIAGLVALVITFIMPTWYAATAKILPPQQSQSAAIAMLGQLAPFAGGMASQALGIKNPTDLYVAMLKSRTIADRLIERFKLKEVYDEELLYYTRKELAGNSSISGNRDGTITIEVEDKSSRRAAELANAYIEELRRLTGTLALSEAAQRRAFFEEQLSKAKKDLAHSETELRSFTEKAGLIDPDGQISLSVSAAATLRAQIAAKEIQLSSMRSFATENNPELKRLNMELTSLRFELAKMEESAKADKGDVMVPFGKAAGFGLEYVRRFRDVKYQEALFEALAKQYEIARIDEAKDATVIQVLDTAIEPERRSKPRRTLIVLIAIAATGVLTALVLYLVHALREPLSRAGVMRGAAPGRNG